MCVKYALCISFPQETEGLGDFRILLKKVYVGIRN